MIRAGPSARKVINEQMQIVTDEKMYSSKAIDEKVLEKS